MILIGVFEFLGAIAIHFNLQHTSTMNNHPKIPTTINCVFFIVFLGLNGLALEAGNAVLGSPGEAELGTHSCAAVTNGFVFYGGEYIPIPYSVVRRGVEIFVNSNLIESISSWPLPESPVFGCVTNLPPVPIGMSDVYDQDKVDLYLSDVINYAIFCGATNRPALVANAMTRLPCVNEAHPFDETCVSITWKTGWIDTELINVFPEHFFVRSSPPTEGELISRGDALVDTYGEKLSSDYYFFFPTPTDVFPRQTGKQLYSMFRVALPLVDASKSAEEISAAVETQTGAPFPVSFCRALLNHKDSLDAAFRARIYGGNPATTQAP